MARNYVFNLRIKMWDSEFLYELKTKLIEHYKRQLNPKLRIKRIIIIIKKDVVEIISQETLMKRGQIIYLARYKIRYKIKRRGKSICYSK